MLQVIAILLFNFYSPSDIPKPAEGVKKTGFVPVRSIGYNLTAITQDILTGNRISPLFLKKVSSRGERKTPMKSLYHHDTTSSLFIIRK
jgi:hypothetical protein